MRPVKEIWQTATNPTCLPATLLLAGVMLYWLISLFGITADDAASDHVGSSDNEASISEASNNGQSHLAAEIASATLRFLNAKGVPFMVVMSILITYLWGSLVFGSMNLPPSLPMLSVILSVGSLVVAIILTSITAIPLKPWYAKLKFEDEPLIPIVGRVGTVRSNEITNQFGQVEVQDKHGPMFINARLAEGQENLTKNSEVIIISLDQEKLVYTVRSTESH